MDIFKSIIDFIVSKERTLSNKFTYTVLILLGLICFDYLTGTIRLWLSSSKVDQIHKIETLLEKQNLDKMTRAYLERTRSEILQMRDFRDHFRSLFDPLKIALTSSKVAQKINTIEEQTNSDSIISRWWVYLHTFTSGWILIIMMIGFPIALAISGNVSSETIAVMTFVEIVLAFCVYLFALVFSFIPRFWDGVGNLIVNFILQWLFFIWARRRTGVTK